MESAPLKDAENAAAPKTTQWMKPNDILKLTKAAKRRLQPRALQPVSLNAINGATTVPVKRERSINPFRCPVQKKPRLEEVYALLHRTTASPQTLSPQRLVVSKVAVDSYDDETRHSLADGAKPEQAKKPPKLPGLPLDWSLKTRIRFCSTSHFPWSGSLKTCEEASGTTGFVRAVHSTGCEESAAERGSLDSSPQARFHQNCLVWMHPHLPWMRLFPRHGVMANASTSKEATSLFADPASPARTALQGDWAQGFRSLYQLLRARQCPYFYVCAPTFTVLFRAAGVAGLADLHALMTPTTRGLRQALRDEGITFSMPLCTSQEQMDETVDGASQSPPSEAKSDGQEENAPEEETVTWLESLGLSQADFPSLNTSRSKMLDETRDDRRPRSLVFVERGETLALFNFLLNSRTCVCPTGPLAGVPPTLISPVAFHGASLRSLKVRQGWVKQNNTDMHMVEMSGPILPSALHGLCTLFGSSQDKGAFSFVASADTPTAAFNAFQPQPQAAPAAFATEALKDCGLSQPFVQQICGKPNGPLPVLTHVHVEDGSYDISGCR